MTLPLRRVMIIGSSGSGKSTLARLLGEILNLPVYHMDRDVYWRPGWAKRPRGDRIRQVERIVARDAWVFEGSNSNTYNVRAARADMLIWLDIALMLRLLRVIRRSVGGRGWTRPDMADDCPERLDRLPGFLWFILSTHRGSRLRARAFYETVSLPKHRFASAREAKRFLETLNERNRRKVAVVGSPDHPPRSPRRRLRPGGLD
ncbi:MAG: DNA topology modulation protein FlaR [Rhodobiaceae bacterium]|nr:DNA topology modulation protein FlaR [Rhodobiaceae bacterium]